MLLGWPCYYSGSLLPCFLFQETLKKINIETMGKSVEAVTKAKSAHELLVSTHQPTLEVADVATLSPTVHETVGKAGAALQRAMVAKYENLLGQTLERHTSKHLRSRCVGLTAKLTSAAQAPWDSLVYRGFLDTIKAVIEAPDQAAALVVVEAALAIA